MDPSTLLAGFVFKKLHNFGNPKERHIRVTPDFKSIIWSTFPELVVKGSVDTIDLLDVVKRDTGSNSKWSCPKDGLCFHCHHAHLSLSSPSLFPSLLFSLPFLVFSLLHDILTNNLTDIPNLFSNSHSIWEIN
jgi:hypothetical protein